MRDAHPRVNSRSSGAAKTLRCLPKCCDILCDQKLYDTPLEIWHIVIYSQPTVHMAEKKCEYQSWRLAQPKLSYFDELAPLYVRVPPSNNSVVSGATCTRLAGVRRAGCCAEEQDRRPRRCTGLFFCFPARQVTSGGAVVAWGSVASLFYCCTSRFPSHQECATWIISTRYKNKQSPRKMCV